MIVTIPIYIGELFDKITILKLKDVNIGDVTKRRNVRRELDVLLGAAAELPVSAELEALVAELSAVNASLWEVEDRKRSKEREGRFDAEFIALARRVYKENDQRAAIKRQINLVTGSALVEEKSYGG